MRRAPLLLLTTGVGLMLLLSSCSQPVAPLDKTAATQLAAVGQSGDQMMYGMMDPTSPVTPASVVTSALTTAGLSVQPLAYCTSANDTTTGWTKDTDSDGIPDHATIQYACSTSGVTMSGTLTVQDKSGMYTGYTVTLSNFKLTALVSGQTYSLSANMTFDLSGSPSTTYTLDDSLDINADFPGSSGSLSMSGHPTYTPDSASDPFAAGTFTLDGQATFVAPNGKTYSVTRKGQNLHFDKANTTCTTDFDAGTVTYVDGQGNTLELAYTCGAVTATYNGGPLP
ncbi:MAG: hypothetical protein P8Y05_02845 [Deinococcales bacterium]